ncbi:MAG: efflux RND transporter periplasmic adaptor subunit, partial [Gemmatimonadota bacterium]
QTVAASLSAPQLFLIANDLSQMQILALVDESDIGQIHVGQTATFTVQSFPNRSFTGEVKQVRLNATTTNNVVDYTTVVAVQNPNGVLLPGMTATVRFITGSADSAYTVPNAALRYRPTPEVLASAGIKTAGDSTLARRTRPAGTTAADSASRPAQPGGRTRSSSLGASTGTRSIVTLWVLDSVGKLSSRRVRTGLTDGQRTQIEGRGLVAGEQVVIGTTDGATTSPSTAPQSSSPFQQPAAPSGRRGPPPGPI